ncbi:MAG: hypothetical protein L6R40_000188 [Gallowayella cf. fulva]|nr:MAG: hypothetical protein L6R40_000188 [Xanthomendoza cf. fulva]
MPKKRSQSYFSKPPTSVHPSISNRSNDSHHHEQPDKSVNDLLQQLRIGQASSAAPTESRSDENPQTVHPSLKHIFQIPETLPLRPRPGMRPAMQGRRRPAGPAPPRSWLECSNQAPTRWRRTSLLQRGHESQQRPELEKLGTIPNICLPSRQSLQHQTLGLLAKNWEFHSHYDQYYLPLLPIRSKQLLLTYIAAYSPNGINAHGLSILFADESIIEGAIGTEGLTHLDLSVSIGRCLSLKDLKQFITTIFPAPTSTDSFTPDSWDLPTSMSPTPTCTLTHLSLSYPPPSISWRHLLQLSPHLNTLTHLSLSHWPSPTLTPNSATAYRSSPTGDIFYGDHDVYSASIDNDFSGAANVLRQLSRDTYCLLWLDLSGCTSWLPSLAWRRDGGVDWDGPWTSVQTVVVAQGWIPRCLELESSRASWRDVLHYRGENSVRKKECGQLKAWADAEVRTEDVLKSIRGDGTGGGKTAALRRISRSARMTDWHGDVAPPVTLRSRGYDDEDSEGKSKEGKSTRTLRLEFQKGWEGWWIEDCLNEYKELLRREHGD